MIERERDQRRGDELATHMRVQHKCTTLPVGGKEYEIFSTCLAESAGLGSRSVAHLHSEATTRETRGRKPSPARSIRHARSSLMRFEYCPFPYPLVNGGAGNHTGNPRLLVPNNVQGSEL